MCAPLLIAAAAVTIASGVVAARGQQQAGAYNAAVGKQNQAAAEQSAQFEEALGSQQADEQRIKTQQALGSQRAALAANGVDLSSGTPADIQADTAALGGVDERRIRANAARQAWGYRVQGVNYRAQGQLDRYSGNVGAFSTILGTAGSALGMLGAGGARTGGASASRSNILIH